MRTEKGNGAVCDFCQKEEEISRSPEILEGEKISI